MGDSREAKAQVVKEVAERLVSSAASVVTDYRGLNVAEVTELRKRLREAGWGIVFTPSLEVVHEQGVSTGRSRRMHLIHAESVYRYFEKHHARGWRRALLPLARLVLRARAELVSALDRLRGTGR
ncbi:MAG: 50S ribosomal protein L10 [Peptococcaceae bacterium]|nr:50S ribosomal protein L10 [Peptococcaceae bacterium]